MSQTDRNLLNGGKKKLLLAEDGSETRSELSNQRQQ